MACAFTNRCKFPFYEVDFVMGQPIWLSGVHRDDEVIVLMDSKDGRVEAWVSLKENHIMLLQQDPKFYFYHNLL